MIVVMSLLLYFFCGVIKNMESFSSGDVPPMDHENPVGRFAMGFIYGTLTGASATAIGESIAYALGAHDVSRANAPGMITAVTLGFLYGVHKNISHESKS
jgi:hypothetical protein